MFMNTSLFEPGKSKTERTFLSIAAKQNTRFDGRKSNEFRDVNLTFGLDWGTVAVSMGDTKVLAQVSCDIGTPTSARPNEGMLYVNADIKGVAYLDGVQVTHDQRSLALNSLLERTFRSSRCLDLESLCIAVEQHAWSVRLDINVLNHDGNLYDASTVAALAALMHFRRPDVSFINDEIRTYSERERDLQPLLFLHYPVSITYCLYKSAAQPWVDPTLMEENSADSLIVLSFNSYEELCTVNAGGTGVQTIMQCARGAAKRAKELVEFVRKALDLDAERRQQPKLLGGFLDMLNDRASKLSFNHLMKEEEQMEITETVESNSRIEAETIEVGKPEKHAQTTVQLTKTPVDDSSWLPEDDQPVEGQQLDTDQISLQAIVPTNAKVSKLKPNRGKNKLSKKQQDALKKQNRSDSEEEVIQIL